MKTGADKSVYLQNNDIKGQMAVSRINVFSNSEPRLLCCKAAVHGDFSQIAFSADAVQLK